MVCNINRLLESSQRSDVRGYNIYSSGIRDFKRPSSEQPIIKKWDIPSLGLTGKIAIGHEINITDLIAPVISADGAELDFCVTRNRWTPAFMDTYYRCKPVGEYKVSGLIAVRERKCFTKDDAFISHMTISNDGRQSVRIKVTLSLPLNKISDGIYSIEEKIIPRSIRKALTLVGFVAAKTDTGDCCELIIPPQGRVQIRYGFAFSALNADDAERSLCEALKHPDPFFDSEVRFNDWMEAHAPRLQIENLDLLKIYYYRFFVIKTAIHTPSSLIPDSDYIGQIVYESPFGNWFGAAVGLPIPLQIEEMKWMRNAGAVRSHIANWCRGFGAMRGYIQFTPMAIWKLYMQTGDKELVSECYEAVKQYTLLKCSSNYRELPVTTGSWVTGAEYQPSFYQHTEPKWDWRCDNEGKNQGFSLTRLYRVDECVMHAANLCACQRMAELLEMKDDCGVFSSRAASAIESIKEICWNEEKSFFFDASADSRAQCDEAYCYDGFLPMMFSLFGAEYHSVFRHLLEDEHFDSGFSLTSVNKDCPMYWFDNCIAGPVASSPEEPHPYGCSWNGPVWPFAVSLVLDALGNASYTDESLRDSFKRLFTEYTELHFDFGDHSTPCICEHYRPTDGISFSPFTEYFHSEWINLFLSYYLGIRISESGISFEPITSEEFSLEGVMIRGKAYRFTQEIKNGRLCREIQAIED